MVVKVERDISENRRKELGVDDWATWSRDKSEFDWSYSDTETCLIIEGTVTVEMEEGDRITASAGDLVQFPEGLDCTWRIEEDLRKVFTFDAVEIRDEVSA